MKHIAEQFPLPIKTERKREDVLFKRKGVRVWQARIWVADKRIRKSTGTRTESTAREILPAIKAHLEREAAKKEGVNCPPPDATNPLLTT